MIATGRAPEIASDPSSGSIRDTADTADAVGGEAGFVLLSILSVVMLFVAVAAGLAITARLHALQAANGRDAVVFEALADGAALFAIDALREFPALADGNPSAVRDPLPRDGTPLVCPLDPPLAATDARAATPSGRRAVLSIVDQGGLLDLNAAPEPMMTAFFAAAGVDARTASGLAGAIVAAREDAHEQSDTSSRTGPFLDPDEVRALGPPAIAAATRRVLPLLTVHNPNPSLDLAVTDRAARLLLPRDADTSPLLKPYLGRSPGTAFRVDVWFESEDGAVRATRRAMVTLATDRSAVPVIRSWSRISDPDPPPIAVRQAATDRPHTACLALRDALGGGSIRE